MAERPSRRRPVIAEDIALLESHDLETLTKMFEERLKGEQNERHDGGNRWIGTGGTSPFGHGGVNPAGIRVGGAGGGWSSGSSRRSTAI